MKKIILLSLLFCLSCKTTDSGLSQQESSFEELLLTAKFVAKEGAGVALVFDENQDNLVLKDPQPLNVEHFARVKNLAEEMTKTEFLRYAKDKLSAAEKVTLLFDSARGSDEHTLLNEYHRELDMPTDLLIDLISIPTMIEGIRSGGYLVKVQDEWNLDFWEGLLERPLYFRELARQLNDKERQILLEMAPQFMNQVQFLDQLADDEVLKKNYLAGLNAIITNQANVDLGSFAVESNDELLTVVCITLDKFTVKTVSPRSVSTLTKLGKYLVQEAQLYAELGTKYQVTCNGKTATVEIRSEKNKNPVAAVESKSLAGIYPLVVSTNLNGDREREPLTYAAVAAYLASRGFILQRIQNLQPFGNVMLETLAKSQLIIPRWNSIPGELQVGDVTHMQDQDKADGFAQSKSGHLFTFLRPNNKGGTELNVFIPEETRSTFTDNVNTLTNMYCTKPATSPNTLIIGTGYNHENNFHAVYDGYYQRNDGNQSTPPDLLTVDRRTGALHPWVSDLWDLEFAVNMINEVAAGKTLADIAAQIKQRPSTVEPGKVLRFINGLAGKPPADENNDPDFVKAMQSLTTSVNCVKDQPNTATGNYQQTYFDINFDGKNIKKYIFNSNL